MRCSGVFVSLVLAVAIAGPAMADEERLRGAPRPTVELAIETPATTAAQEHALYEEAAYDMIIVPRTSGASRSRVFTGQGWMTLPQTYQQQRPTQRYAAPRYAGPNSYLRRDMRRYPTAPYSMGQAYAGPKGYPLQNYGYGPRDRQSYHGQDRYVRSDERRRRPGSIWW